MSDEINVRLISIKEVATWLQMDEQTIYRKVESGTIPYIRIGNTVRFNPIKIAEWLDELSVDAKKITEESNQGIIQGEPNGESKS